MTTVRFCSACGARLPSSAPVACAACGERHWLNPKPCANAIVVDDGKVLLARRAYSPWCEMWTSPGGFSDVGEHPIQTVEREVLEETGLEVCVTGYIGVWVDRYADHPDDSDADVINVAYYHAVPTGNRAGRVDPDEVSEVRWFPWEELPAELAPPETLPSVLAAARQAHDDGGAVTTLPDQPR